MPGRSLVERVGGSFETEMVICVFLAQKGRVCMDLGM